MTYDCFESYIIFRNKSIQAQHRMKKILDIINYPSKTQLNYFYYSYRYFQEPASPSISGDGASLKFCKFNKLGCKFKVTNYYYHQKHFYLLNSIFY